MSFPPGANRFQRKSPPIGRKKSRRTYIDPDDFYLMRRRAFLTIQQASELLDVTKKTVLNWEQGKSPIPYTAYRVLKMKVGYVFNDEFFKDWFVKGDTFWSPEGRGFKPHELRYISNYFWMARQWLAEQQAQSQKRRMDLAAAPGQSSTALASSQSYFRTAPISAAERVKSSTDDRGAPPSQDLRLPNAADARQQDRPADFEKFLESLGIAA
jgi:DNA-binding XRE family transcriptional regulator